MYRYRCVVKCAHNRLSTSASAWSSSGALHQDSRPSQDASELGPCACRRLGREGGVRKVRERASESVSML